MSPHVDSVVQKSETQQVEKMKEKTTSIEGTARKETKRSKKEEKKKSKKKRMKEKKKRKHKV